MYSFVPEQVMKGADTVLRYTGSNGFVRVYHESVPNAEWSQWLLRERHIVFVTEKEYSVHGKTLGFTRDNPGEACLTTQMVATIRSHCQPTAQADKKAPPAP